MRVRLSPFALATILAISSAFPLAAPVGQLLVTSPSFEALCRFDDTSSPKKPDRDGKINIPCLRRPQLVRCDGASLEPKDIPLGDACRNETVQLALGAPGTLAVSIPTEVAAEWLNVTESGDTATIARRVLRVHESAPVRLARLSGRFLRLHRPGVSPVTVSARDFLDNQPWQLPAARPGGELFGRVERAAVAPSGIALRGPWTGFVQRTADYVAIQGLPAGQYEVAPIYDGGISGRPSLYTVNSELTTLMPLRRSDLGGVNIKLNSSCDPVSELTLQRVTGPVPPEVLTLREIVASLPPNDHCHWVVGGLPPGSYVAASRLKGGSSESGKFQIHSQQWTEVSIPAPTSVRVTSRVLYNGRPWVGRTLLFTHDAVSARSECVVDEGGICDVALDVAGDYTVILRGEGIAPQRRALRFKEGLNSLAWETRGGTLTVRVDASRGFQKTIVEVNSNTASGGQIGSFEGPRGELRWEGLPFGTYSASAHQDDLVSLKASATLTENAPDVTVDIELLENRSFVRIRDRNGMPIESAAFRSQSLLARPKEIGPGIYSLGAFAAGSTLRVRGGRELVPSCFRVPKSDTLDVVLLPARVITIAFTDVAARDAVLQRGALSLPDSQGCLIPLSDFNWEQSQAKGQFVTVRVDNFPLDDNITLIIDGDSRPLRVAAGKIILH